MKKALKFLFILVFVLPTIVSAQDNAPKKGWKFGMHSVGLAAGLYNPNFDYYNDGTYTKDWSSKFKVAPIFGANLELDVYDNVRVRVEGSYWKQTAKDENIAASQGGGSKELSVSLVPITGTLLFNILPTEKIQAYVGVGGGTCFVTTNYSRTGADGKIAANVAGEDKKGSDAIWSLVQGLDIPLAANLKLGIEAKFIFGHYNQQFTGKPTRSISLHGMEGLVTLNYAFGK